jgi:hypothetical protein
MSSSAGWVEAEGTEGTAQEAGIPGAVLKAASGVRVVIVALSAVKAAGAKGDREEEAGMDTHTDATPAQVPAGANQAGETEARRERWDWVESSVWTDPMLAALHNGVREGQPSLPNMGTSVTAMSM